VIDPDKTAEFPPKIGGVFEDAKAAATNGDAKKMVEILMAGGYVPGLARRMQARWPRLPADDIDFAVARAMETIYFDIRDGKRIADIHSFMWKVADRRAYERDRERQVEIATDPDELALVSDRMGRTSAVDAVEDEDSSRRRTAVAIARSLLPSLGQESIQQVFSLVLDALERDEIHLSNSDIAEMTGLSPDTVRTSLSRGFRRLERLARQKGLLAPVEELREAALIGSNSETAIEEQ
jgi:DNA-directed RNA polymerase specialized sigma24 family protein